MEKIRDQINSFQSVRPVWLLETFPRIAFFILRVRSFLSKMSTQWSVEMNQNSSGSWNGYFGYLRINDSFFLYLIYHQPLNTFIVKIFWLSGDLMSGIDSIVEQMIFWIVTFLPKYHYFYLSWQGRHKFYPIIVNFVTNSTNCKSNFFHLWTHQSYPRCENKHLSIYSKICKYKYLL